MLELKDLETKQTRQFLIRKRYPHKTFSRRIQVEENKRKLMLFEVPKKQLEDEQISQHFKWVLNTMKSVGHSSIIKPESLCEDANNLYVVVVDEILATFSELIQKRQRLSQFELKYFLMQLYYSINHLRSKGNIIIKLCMDDLNLDLTTKINFGFAFWFCQIPMLPKIKRLMKLSHVARYSNFQSDDPDKLIVWQMALLFYNLLQGRPLILNQYDRQQFNEHKITINYRSVNSQAHLLLEKMLFSKDFKLNNLPYEPFLNSGVPKVLPQSILYCPPSKRFQQDIAKSIKLEQSINPKRRYLPVAQQQKKDQNQMYSLQASEDDELVYVDQFCDITCKFGYGYKMSNGLIGFYFNDRTLLLLVEQSNTRELRYFDQNWIQKVYRQEKLLDQHDLKKKLYILDAFRKATCQFKKPAPAIKKLVYIKNYVKVKNAKLFLLSNDSAQSKFIDNTQILCLHSQGSLYYDKKSEDFVSIAKQDSSQILIRQNYTKELSMKLFNWLKPCDQVKYDEDQII